MGISEKIGNNINLFWNGCKIELIRKFRLLAQLQYTFFNLKGKKIDLRLTCII